MSPLTFRPVIIIGAARSGTNMLRDVLAQHPSSMTWPCDEIPYIWRYGNARFPTDEFPESFATEKVRKYIRQQAVSVAEGKNINILVEKTCANSLRIPYVHKIFPEACFLVIYRNSYDVVASAMKRWTASLDLSYTFEKARFVPIADAPYYSFSFVANRIKQVFSRDRRLSSWGPKFDGMDTALKNYKLEEVCALQWQSCVQATKRDIKGLPQSKIFEIQYEDFVQSPVDKLQQLSSFLDVPLTVDQATKITQNISTESVGKGHKSLSIEQITRVSNILSK
jgi:hypothetical protein